MTEFQNQKTDKFKTGDSVRGYIVGEKLKSQKDAKPKVEDVAGDFIGEDELVNLMDFLGFLRENKLSPRWASGNSWSVKFKGKNVCYIKIIGASWYVFHSHFTREKWFVGYDKYFSDDALKKFVWENISGGYCPKNCMGRKKTVFGKELVDICTCWPYRLENPDGATLEQSKNVILAIKRFINEN
jgi:hypothetical protein